MELELADKAWARKKKEILASFPNHMLESAWIKFAFPYGLSPRHKEVKRNTIGVVGESNAKVPHCTSTSLALIYLMENKIPFIHHVVEQWRCNYTDEDDKGLNERTQGYSMLKPKSKLM
jgi:hypothetical protein